LAGLGKMAPDAPTLVDLLNRLAAIRCGASCHGDNRLENYAKDVVLA
jgi:hypothetical protein